MGRPPSTDPKSLPVSVRLPPAVKAAAEKAAKDDTRSLSSLLEKVLTDHLKANGYLSGGPTGTLAGEAPVAEAQRARNA